jgi:hypothetical protein
VYNILFNSGSAANAQFMNNLIVQEDESGIGYSAGTGIIFSHNLWSKSPPKKMLGKSSIVKDPLFTRLGSTYSPDWYILTSESPAIGKAMPLAEISLDFFGTVRDLHPEIGAIEFISP